MSYAVRSCLTRKKVNSKRSRNMILAADKRMRTAPLNLRGSVSLNHKFADTELSNPNPVWEAEDSQQKRDDGSAELGIVLELLAVVPVLSFRPHCHLIKTSDHKEDDCKEDRAESVRSDSVITEKYKEMSTLQGALNPFTAKGEFDSTGASDQT